uniref:Scavenger receptor class F member 2 n=1 Tax=Magallana gigas TaxID=29159 RepID=A0A8W8P2M7_MAGGI
MESVLLCSFLSVWISLGRAYDNLALNKSAWQQHPYNGCPIPGYYGEDCSLPCPQNCQESHCHIVDGSCLGCVPGYKGPTCNEKCLDQTYGLECQRNCGNCKNKEPCHHVNGNCLNGCASGFYGDTCNLVCKNNTFGSKCSFTCGNCLYPYGEQCHHETGQCQHGCDVGFHGDRCDQASSDPASPCQSSTALYVSVTIIVLSVLLNVFFIIRQLRKSLCTSTCLQQKIPDNVDKHFDGKNIELEKTTHVSKSKYDQAEDNAAYQELGEITKESPYNYLH